MDRAPFAGLACGKGTLQEERMATPTLTRPEGSEPKDFDVSRRGVAGLFFAGYAAFAASADAAPIHTDDAGLITAEVMAMNSVAT